LFSAVTAYPQLPAWESGNSAAMQAYREQRYGEAEGLLKAALERASEFGQSDPRFGSTQQSSQLRASTTTLRRSRTTLWAPPAYSPKSRRDGARKYFDNP